jgi:ClpP class serine protease
VDATAIVGSIGSIIGFYDFSGYEKKLGIRHITMVSSQSPRKAMDPTTPEGREDWQRVLDDLAAVFITGVAEFRDVDEATVLEEFGEGSVFVGQAALDAGLADALGTAETVHATLLAELDAPPATISTVEAAVMARSQVQRSARPKASVPPVQAAADEEDLKERESIEDAEPEKGAGAKGGSAAVDEEEEEREEDDEVRPAKAFAAKA